MIEAAQELRPPRPRHGELLHPIDLEARGEETVATELAVEPGYYTGAWVQDDARTRGPLQAGLADAAAAAV